MKATELRDILNAPRMQRHLDDEVVVLLSEPSMGPRAMTGVRYATSGSDWEKGRLLLSPTDYLVRRSENQALWQAARDLLFMLSGESRHVKGEERLTGLAKEVRELFKRFGLRPRKPGTFIPEEVDQEAHE